MSQSPYLITPGKKVHLAKLSTDDTGPFKDKEDAEAVIQKNLKKLRDLQELLYAESKYALLVVLQAMDAGGKDGAIDHVFSGVNPQGCSVSSFKQPSHEELAHDYLWRIHQRTPAKGMITIFNRSHYESVLVERVNHLVGHKVWSRRYDHINAFEKMLTDEGTVVLKFFLNISKEEQKRRMQARLADPAKNWKFSPSDLPTRKHWDDYMAAYQDVLANCSTDDAPWYAVPSDRKWFRNWVLSDTIVRTLKSLHMKFPKGIKGIEKVKIH